MAGAKVAGLTNVAQANVAQGCAGTAVTVCAPARLHLGFVDLNGSLGRRFGSLGLALDAPYTEIRVRWAETFDADGPGAPRALRIAQALCQRLEIPGCVHVSVSRSIPAHAGLGSGTQMSLAVATAIGRLAGVVRGPRGLAQLLDRGARSGIGLGAFCTGGFLVDGGRGEEDAAPPVIVRQPLPDAWRVLLVLDESGRGLHGCEERAAFANLSPFPEALAGKLCRLVLMSILPALVEGDIQAFARGITQVQRANGDHFSGVQGGRFRSPAVAAILEWLECSGAAGVGQSSWGPTGFAIVDGAQRALELLEAARERAPASARLRFEVVRPRNRGHEIRIEQTLGRGTPRHPSSGRPGIGAL